MVAWREQVAVRRLDEVIDQVAPAGAQRFCLKLDTQGFDLEVFAGASRCVDKIVGLQSEMAVLPVYRGAPDYVESLATYRAAGFEATGFFPVSREAERLVLVEFDCVMTKTK